MTCPACAAFERNPNSGAGRTDCMECRARGLARSLRYFLAAQAKHITTDYRESLQVAFGDDWQAGHARVKAWAQRITDAAAA